MKILFVTPQPPWPPRQGTALRNFHLLRALAGRHEVDLLTFAADVQDGEPDSALSDPAGDDAPAPRDPTPGLCRQVVTVPAPRRTPLARLRDLGAGLADMEGRLRSPAFSARLRQLLQEHDYDAVQLEGFEVAGHLLGVRGPASRSQGSLTLAPGPCPGLRLPQRRVPPAALRRPGRRPPARPLAPRRLLGRAGPAPAGQRGPLRRRRGRLPRRIPRRRRRPGGDRPRAGRPGGPQRRGCGGPPASIPLPAPRRLLRRQAGLPAQRGRLRVAGRGDHAARPGARPGRVSGPRRARSGPRRTSPGGTAGGSHRGPLRGRPGPPPLPGLGGDRSPAHGQRGALQSPRSHGGGHPPGGHHPGRRRDGRRARTPRLDRRHRPRPRRRDRRPAPRPPPARRPGHRRPLPGGGTPRLGAHHPPPPRPLRPPTA